MSKDLDEGLGCGCFLVLAATALVILFCGHHLIRSLASLLDRLAQ